MFATATVIPPSPTNFFTGISNINQSNQMNFSLEDSNTSLLDDVLDDDFTPIPVFPQASTTTTTTTTTSPSQPPKIPAPTPLRQASGPVVSGSRNNSNSRMVRFDIATAVTSPWDQHGSNNPPSKTCTCFPEPSPLFVGNPGKVTTSKDKYEKDFLHSLLHRVCQQYPRKKRYVEAAFKQDPSAIGRRVLIPAQQQQPTAGGSQKQFQQCQKEKKKKQNTTSSTQYCASCKLPTLSTTTSSSSSISRTSKLA